MLQALQFLILKVQMIDVLTTQHIYKLRFYLSQDIMANLLQFILSRWLEPQKIIFLYVFKEYTFESIL